MVCEGEGNGLVQMLPALLIVGGGDDSLDSTLAVSENPTVPSVGRLSFTSLRDSNGEVDEALDTDEKRAFRTCDSSCRRYLWHNFVIIRKYEGPGNDLRTSPRPRSY